MKTRRNLSVDWRKIAFLIIAILVVVSMLGGPVFYLIAPPR